MNSKLHYNQHRVKSTHIRIWGFLVFRLLSNFEQRIIWAITKLGTKLKGRKYLYSLNFSWKSANNIFFLAVLKFL